MKFITKQSDSEILSKNLFYKEGNSKRNREIKDILNREQNNFCAYHEIFMDEHDRVATDVEDFNKHKKSNDNYYNYYSVCVAAHRLKTRREQEKDNAALNEKAISNEGFFQSLFFQDKQSFQARIKYIGDQYVADDNDQEAKDLIKYLGWNKEPLFTKRKNHIKKLIDFNFSKEELLNLFVNSPSEMNFPTAIENEFGIDLSEIISFNI